MDSLRLRPFSLIALSGALLCTACGEPAENQQPVATVPPSANEANPEYDLEDLELEDYSELSANPLTADANQPQQAGGQNPETGGVAAQAGQGAADDLQVSQAIAVVSPLDGSNVRGTVVFNLQDNGILVEASLTGMSPGAHGFHIHEFGDCGGERASAAGDHFNPYDRSHGDPAGNPGERHVGDLGNLEANDQGTARYSRVDPVLTFQGENNILGKAIVAHGMEDDLVSQPGGNSGDPVACGIIESGSDELTQESQQQESPDNV